MQLRAANYTYDEIAELTGLASWRSVQNYIQRFAAKTLQEFNPIVARAQEALILQRLEDRLQPWAIPDDPLVPPDPKMVDAFLKASKAKRVLLGLDAPTKVEFSAPELIEAGDAEAEDVQRFIELADTLQKSGYGSGIIIDVEEVAEEDLDGEKDSVGRPVPTVGNVAPQLELARVAEVGNMTSADIAMQELSVDLDAPDFTPDMEEMEDGIGKWVDGRYVINTDDGEGM